MLQINSIDRNEFSIKELWQAVYKKKLFIFIAGISLAILSFFTSYFIIDWKYESTAQIYVFNKKSCSSEVTYSDIQLSSDIINDYIILTTSRLISQQVIKELKLDMEHEDFIKLIHVENPSQTRILNISAKYKDPLKAKQIADAVCRAVESLMTRLTAQDLTNSISEANLPDKPSTPNVKHNTVLGGILGVMVSTFILLLRYISVKQTTADRKDEIQVEIEVTIPDTDKAPDKEDES